VISLDFKKRSEAAEWMDDPAADYEVFSACLADLAKANRWTLAHRPTLGFLARLEHAGLWPKDRPLRLLDVGSGYGDLMREADRWAQRRGLALDLTGVDLSPWSAEAARRVTPPGRPIVYLTGDAFAQEGRFDVVTSGLFTHHLPQPLIVRFLRFMEARAEIGWFINDLHRHLAPYAGFALLSRVMGWHPFVQHDGPISVARAFRRADWSQMILEAGLGAAEAEVSWRFPFRLCVARLKGRP
jgi:SAM-dependent methyltransferase